MKIGPPAAPLHGPPDRDLVLAGATGTNGKSTTVELVAAMLDAAGRPAGRIGTLGYRFPGLDAPEAERTTPEASELFRLLATMRRLGARAAAMEVSSHALVQGRVAGVGFDVGLFTNLTRDHLDFHRDLEDYFAAKSRLFDQLKPGGRAVVPTADDWGRRLAERSRGRSRSDPAARWRRSRSSWTRRASGASSRPRAGRSASGRPCSAATTSTTCSPRPPRRRRSSCRRRRSRRGSRRRARSRAAWRRWRSASPSRLPSSGVAA